MELTKRVQVLISETTEKGEFRDALYFSDEEYEALKVGDAEALAAARVADWLDKVNNPPPVPEPTKEELEAQEAALVQQIEVIQSEKQERFGE